MPTIREGGGCARPGSLAKAPPRRVPGGCYAAVARCRFSSTLSRKRSVVSSLAGANQEREIFVMYQFRPYSTQTRFERRGEARQVRVVVKLGAVGQPQSRRRSKRWRWSRSLLALLVLAVVARDRAVGGLGLDGAAVRRHQHGGHQAKRAKALRYGVRLHVAVVVLARPDVAAGPLRRRGSAGVISSPSSSTTGFAADLAMVSPARWSRGPIGGERLLDCCSNAMAPGGKQG